MSGGIDDGTYAPKSPDLSCFDSTGPTPPVEPSEAQLQPPSSETYFSSSHQQQHPLNVTQARATNTRNTSKPSGFGVGVAYPSTTQHEYIPPRAPIQPFSGQAQPVPGYAPQQQQSAFYQPPYRSSFQYQYPQQLDFSTQARHLIAAQAQVRSQQDQQPQYVHAVSAAPAAPEVQHTELSSSLRSQTVQERGSQAQAEQAEQRPSIPVQDITTPMPPRRAAAAAAAALAAQAASAQGATAPPEKTAAAAGPSSSAAAATEPLVKTKFPTARIKRIMQADEEVGKVAQQTPIAVGKALELFMVALVSKSAELARQRSSKRVSAQMLKEVIESDDQWDFLRDIVSKVENSAEKAAAAGKGSGGGSGSGGGAGGGGRGVKSESDSEDEGRGKKKRGGRKKKATVD
ncbi:hypothetical protein VTK56DRAFT_2326 [Thermocarpiscus australiensis]